MDKEAIKRMLNEEIKKIAEDNNIYNENFTEFDSAEKINLDISPNDITFRTVEGDCACALYTSLHAICRIPELKKNFFDRIRKNNDNYYFITIKYPQKVCYKIPIKTIKTEKEANFSRLFPSNNEIISAISVYTMVKTYERLNFFERTSYITIPGRFDILLDQETKNIGVRTNAYLEAGNIVLKTSEHSAKLLQNGDIMFDDEVYTGSMIVCFADYTFMPKTGAKEGHATVCYFDHEFENWRFFDNKGAGSGEVNFSSCVPRSFSTMSTIIGLYRKRES